MQQTSLDESFQVLLDCSLSLVFSLVQMQLAFARLLGGSDSFSGRRKLFWGNDDHLKSRAALSFQLDLLVLQQYSCAIWTLRRNYRGISLDETLLESSLREKAEWKLSKSPKCSGLLSVSHQWKKTAIYGGLIPQSAPSYTLIHKNTVFSKLKFNHTY